MVVRYGFDPDITWGALQRYTAENRARYLDDLLEFWREDGERSADAAYVADRREADGGDWAR